jgi:glutamyl-tRNA synthetase
MIGWNPADPGSDQELFTVQELIERFDFSRMQKGGAVFNIDKLNWFNREYIKKLDSASFWNHAAAWLPEWASAEQETLNKIEHLIRDRMDKFSDLKELLENEFVYFFKAPTVDSKMIVWKTLKEDSEGLAKTKDYLKHVQELLEPVAESDWDTEARIAVMPFAEKEGKGNVLWPLRVSLSGKEKSPDPFELMSILGKEETLKRIAATI